MSACERSKPPSRIVNRLLTAAVFLEVTGLIEIIPLRLFKALHSLRAGVPKYWRASGATVGIRESGRATIKMRIAAMIRALFLDLPLIVDDLDASLEDFREFASAKQHASTAGQNTRISEVWFRYLDA
jgi:hypothetical protein